jgi:equilibrative nucleoside transporter 1/2/3
VADRDLCLTPVVGDFVGRTYLPAIPSLLITNPRRVLALSLARTLFVPLFLACNVAVSPATTGSKPLLNSDTAYFLILIAFGLTNG